MDGSEGNVVADIRLILGSVTKSSNEVICMMQHQNCPIWPACPIRYEIRVVDSQSDLTILL